MKNISISILSIIFILNISCNNNTEPKIIETDSVIAIDSNHISLLGKLDYTIKRFPLPNEIITALYNVNPAFNEPDLNKVSNISSYTNQYSKAINLGIFGTDLIYSIRHNQTQISLNYLKTSQKISNEIGVNSAFDEKTMSKFSDNIDDKDSLVCFTRFAFSNLKKTLRNNDQIDLVVLIITGTWIEGLHLATSNYTESKIDDLTNELTFNIYDYKNQVKTLIDIFKELRKNDPYFNSLYSDLKKVDDFYSNLYDSNTISKEEIGKLSLLLKEIREKLIS